MDLIIRHIGFLLKEPSVLSFPFHPDAHFTDSGNGFARHDVAKPYRARLATAEVEATKGHLALQEVHTLAQGDSLIVVCLKIKCVGKKR